MALADPRVEERMLRMFPPLIPPEEVIGRRTPLPVISNSAVFTDCHGRILALTLPGILPPHRQVRFRVARHL